MFTPLNEDEITAVLESPFQDSTDPACRNIAQSLNFGLKDIGIVPKSKYSQEITSPDHFRDMFSKLNVPRSLLLGEPTPPYLSESTERRKRARGRNCVHISSILRKHINIPDCVCSPPYLLK
jgi:hypothetical protein